MRIILTDLGLPQVGATTLFEDNQTCVKMSESLGFHSAHAAPRCTLPLAPRASVVHDKMLHLVYVNTLDRVADCLTKPLSAGAIRRFHGALSGMAPIPHPDFGAGYGRIGLSLASPDTMPLLCL
jgi:hypothetical protein